MYFNGLGVEQNYEKAIEWFRKAVLQDDVSSMVYLGRCYMNGWGVNIDTQKGKGYFKKAAEQGNEDAKKALERMR